MALIFPKKVRICTSFGSRFFGFKVFLVWGEKKVRDRWSVVILENCYIVLHVQ